MGRPPGFSPSRIQFPGDVVPSLDSLKAGQKIRLTFPPFDYDAPPRPVTRTASTYGSVPTCSTAHLLEVVNVDFEPHFMSNGVRAILLKDPTIPEEIHVYTWVLTTDGYTRELETYGILDQIVEMTVLDSQ